ncbi:MAG: choice-of-anchor J domain-containing protein, partial [Bacteroidales bacterium]|nr:choice-of-anchor J domain-containing protein [Bacteroidales bacterium]
SCSAYPIPFSETFDHCIASNAAPIGPCWYKKYVSTNAENSYPFPTITNAKYDGDKNLVFYGGNTNTAYSYVVLPELASPLSQLQLSLKLRTPNRTASMNVGVITTPSDISTFQQVQTVTTTSTTAWQSFTVPLSSVTTSNARIAIRQGSSDNQAVNIYLDDILVEAIPACNGPARVTVDNILFDRARVHWPASTSTGATYTVEYGPAGFALGQGTQLTGLTDTVATLTGLTSGTAYTVYVHASCGNINQSARVSATFTSGCEEELPYSYGFEILTANGNTTTVPCWTLYGNSRVYRNNAQSSYAADGYCRLQFALSTTNNVACAVLPKLSDSLSHVYMTLQYQSQQGQSGVYCPLVVGIVSNPYDISTFTPVDTLTPTAGGWGTYQVDFSRQNADGYIALRAAYRQPISYVYIDDIHVMRIAPHNITLTVADASRGTVSINGVASNHAQALTGSTVTLAAQPNYGYSFGHWVAGNSANPYVFAMPDHDVTYNNIVFVKNRYTVTLVASPDNMGVVTGSGQYDYLDTALLTATPAVSTYSFVRWSDGNITNPRRLVVRQDTTLTAIFSGCLPVYSTVDTAFCESYTWHDSLITTTGSYTWIGTSAAGCDSIVTLNLTILHGTHNTVYDTAVGSYTWHDTLYTVTGVYTYNYTNDNGCASTDTLRLEIIDPYAPVLVDETHPFSDGFENGNCWQMFNGDLINKWTVGSAASNGGNNSLYISNNNGRNNEYTINATSEAVFAAKTFILPAGHYYFSYDWKGQGESTYDYMRVALAPASVTLTPSTDALSGMTTTQVPSGWISLDGNQKKNQSNMWLNYVAEANITTAGNYQMVFYWRNDNAAGAQPPAAVDNVSIIKSNCTRPTNIVASNVTGTTATLTWNGTAGSYEVAYGTTTVVADMTTQTVNGTTLQLTSLSPSTIYNVYVKSVCGDSEQSPWSVVYTFTTQCGALTSLPYIQGFEESTSGSSTSFNVNCWNRYTSSGNYPYVYGTASYAHTGSKSLYWYSSTNYTSQYIVLPEVETTLLPLNTLRLKFWTRVTSTSYHPTLIVGVMTNPADINTFATVESVDCSNTEYGEHIINLNSYTGTGRYIAIRAQISGSWTVYLDDFTLEEIPACPEPTSITTISTTVSSATLAWAGTNAGSYTVAYGTGSNVNTMDTVRVNVAMATLTNLSASSEYHVYIRANCPGESSPWSQAFTFRTQCGLITTLPYTEDFNSATASSSVFDVPCWQRTASSYYPYANPTSARSGNGLYWYCPNTAGAYQYAILPAFDVTLHPINTLMMTFWTRSSSTTYHPVIEVGVMSNPTDTHTFVPVSTFNIEGTSYTEQTVYFNNYTGNGQYIALRGVQTGSVWYAYLDDFTVDVAPACIEPTNVSVTNITTTTATLSWQGTAQSYTVAYGTGVSLTGMATRTTTATSLSLTGLTPNTEYHVLVRAT